MGTLKSSSKLFYFTTSMTELALMKRQPSCMNHCNLSVLPVKEFNGILLPLYPIPYMRHSVPCLEMPYLWWWCVLCLTGSLVRSAIVWDHKYQWIIYFISLRTCFHKRLPWFVHDAFYLFQPKIATWNIWSSMSIPLHLVKPESCSVLCAHMGIGNVIYFLKNELNQGLKSNFI